VKFMELFLELQGSLWAVKSAIWGRNCYPPLRPPDSGTQFAAALLASLTTPSLTFALRNSSEEQ